MEEDAGTILSNELRNLAERAVGVRANWPARPKKITHAVVVPDDRYAKVEFRANEAEADDKVQDDLIFDLQVLYEAFYASADFVDVDRLEVVAYLELPGKRDERLETRIAEADLRRDRAELVPWNSISITKFRGILEREARLYLQAGPYE